MTKNAKILIGSAAGIAVLSGATAALLLTQPQTEEEQSGSSPKIEVLSYKTDDIASLEVKNEFGEYTINRIGVEKWEISSIPEDYASTTAYSNAMNGAASINAKLMVEENAQDLEKYGFSEPTAEFTMTFKDGKEEPVTCLLGLRNEGESAWYFKTDLNDTVYLVSESALSFATSKELDYVNVSTLVDSYDSENDVVNRIRVEREDLDKDIVLDRLPEETEKEFASTYVAYAMSGHNNILADDELDGEVVYGMFGLSAYNVYTISPDDKQKAETGLDTPYCTVTMVANEEEVTKLYIGDPIYVTTTNEETGEETTAVAGYYGMLSTDDVIYMFYPDDLPWLTVTPESILYRLFLTPYIYYVDTVTVYDADRKGYELKITGNADGSSFTYGDKEIEEARFKVFYQYLLSAYAEKIYLEELTEENKFVAGFTYDYREDEEGEDVVEFYSSEADRTCIIVVNGDVRYKVRQIYAERLLQNLDALINGGELVSDF